jgi:hypothetical protein
MSMTYFKAMLAFEAKNYSRIRLEMLRNLKSGKLISLQLSIIKAESLITSHDVVEPLKTFVHAFPDTATVG